MGQGRTYGWNPATSIGQARRSELTRYARTLIAHYIPGGRFDTKVTYTEYGDMLVRVRNNPTLNDTERFYVMNVFTERVGTGPSTTHPAGAHPAVKDDFRPLTSAAHAFIPTHSKFMNEEIVRGSTNDAEIWRRLYEREKGDISARMPPPLQGATRAALRMMFGTSTNLGDAVAHYRHYQASKAGFFGTGPVSFQKFVHLWRRGFLENP